MKYFKHLSFAIALLLSGILCAKETKESHDFFGTAKDESGEVVYYEDHHVEYTQEGHVAKIETKYLRPNKDREVFARLESRFDQSKFVPESEFEDLRFKHIEKTYVDASKNKLTIEHIDKKDKSKEVLELTRNMVLGQGYHNYIITHLNKFKPNEKRTLDFVVPAKQTFYKFDLTYLGKKSKSSQNVTLRLDITNWFLKLFASKIEVEYDPETKRLMAYRGLTNIVNDEGDNQSLNITFEYPKTKRNKDKK